MKRTNPSSSPPQGAGRLLKLGVLADPQYADLDPSYNRFYRDALNRVERAVEWMNDQLLDAVIVVGDVIDRDFESFAPIMRVLDRLSAPRLVVPGNHDFSVDRSKLADVLPALGLDTGYSAKQLGDWRVLLLDGTEVSTYRTEHAEQAEAWLERLREADHPEAQTWNGGMSDEQLAWLDEQLTQADTADQPVLLVCHFPVWPHNSHCLWNHAEVVALLDEHPCAKAWLNGHHHRGGRATRGHCEYYTFKAIVEGEHVCPVGLVTLDGATVKIEEFDLDDH